MRSIGAFVFILQVVFFQDLAMAQSTAASVSIDTTKSTPLNPGFAGFNSPQAKHSVEDYDVNYQKLAATLSPGWLRYPGGTVGDAFSWATGELSAAWVSTLNSEGSVNLQSSLEITAGKGGESIDNFALLAKACNAKIMICFNGFTDTPASAGAFAAYVKAHNIPIAVWELSNEPYESSFSSFWPTGTDYANAMKPYRDAIKAVDPNATVSLFFTASNAAKISTTAWDVALAQYPNKYWDAVSFHHYPSGGSVSSLADVIPYANNDLANNSTASIDALNKMNPAGMKYVISEYGAYNATSTGPTATDSVYGGVEVAEYLLRMSSRPEVLFAGMHELYQSNGIIPTNSHDTDTKAAYTAGKTIDTSQFHDFGWYMSAEILGASVVNGALAHATQVVSTTLTGGATVPSQGTPATIAALYAQAYQDAQKNTYLLVTNKDSQNESVTITVNGATGKGSYAMTYLSSTDPTATNTVKSPNAVQVQTQTVTNPVTIPPYSVVRLDLGGGAAGSSRPLHRRR